MGASDPVRARGWRVLLVAVVLFAGIKLLFGRPARFPDEFVATPPLATALVRAHATGKPALVLVTADWCAACQTLKKGSLAEDSVRAWIRDNTHPVLLDATKANPAADALGVESLPTMVIVRPGPTGEHVVSRLVGAAKVEPLLAWLAEHSGPRADEAWRQRHAAEDPGPSPP